jgi:hypothetical protein
MNADTARRRALDNLPRRVLAPAGADKSSPPSFDIYSEARHSYTAFPYTKVVWMNYQPSRGIQVHFASHTVFIVGHDLGKVYEGIRDWKLRSIGPEEAAAGPRTPGVEAVYIRQVSKSEPGFAWPSDAALEAEQAD